jgi:hypothetical protein
MEQVFDPCFATKAKVTGLGMAIAPQSGNLVADPLPKRLSAASE